MLSGPKNVFVLYVVFRRLFLLCFGVDLRSMCIYVCVSIWATAPAADPPEGWFWWYWWCWGVSGQWVRGQLSVNRHKYTELHVNTRYVMVLECILPYAR